MKAFKHLMTVLFLLTSLSATAAETGSGSFYVGREGTDMFSDFTVDKAQSELVITSDLCNRVGRELVLGGCEVIKGNVKLKLSGSYPSINNKGLNSISSLTWNCKIKNAAAGDLVRVRTICK